MPAARLTPINGSNHVLRLERRRGSSSSVDGPGCFCLPLLPRALPEGPPLPEDAPVVLTLEELGVVEAGSFIMRGVSVSGGRREGVDSDVVGKPREKSACEAKKSSLLGMS